MSGLQDLHDALADALRQAGISPTEENIRLAVDVWNAVNGASMSRGDFVQALRWSFAASNIPVRQRAPSPQPSQPSNQGMFPTDLGIDVQPGLPAQQWAEEQAQALEIARQQYQTSEDIANINAAADRYVADLSAATQQAINSGQISADQAIAAMQIASQEAMQARDLALRQLISDREYETSKAALALQERELKANLAANPADWLTYQAFLSGGTLPSGVSASGEATAPVPGDVIAQIASSLTAPDNTLYNPALAGVGVGGAHVPGPQEVSHQTASRMSPTELQMLTGFLKSGIEINGKRVAINPEDWFQMAAQGWVPTVQESAFTPEYSF